MPIETLLFTQIVSEHIIAVDFNESVLAGVEALEGTRGDIVMSLIAHKPRFFDPIVAP